MSADGEDPHDNFLCMNTKPSVVYNDYRGGSRALGVASDSSFFVVCTSVVSVYNPFSKEKTATVDAHNRESANGADVSACNQYVAVATTQDQAFVVDIGAEKKIASLDDAHKTQATNNIAFSRTDNRYVVSVSDSSDGDKSVALWDLRECSKPAFYFQGHKNDVEGVAFSTQPELLVTASRDDTCAVWDFRAPYSKLASIKDHQNSVYKVAISKDARHAGSGGACSQLVSWSPRDAFYQTPTDGILKGKRWNHSMGGTIHAVALCDRFAACGASDKIRVFDVENNTTFDLEHTLSDPGDMVWSADGSLLLAVGSAGVYQWDIPKIVQPVTTTSLKNLCLGTIHRNQIDTTGLPKPLLTPHN
eukprot:CAMPEP_0201545698 /NCGR_PEP_ID=MMETSP0173_2-20130828/2135_1 /ASSEMBLY_ACC=CAM_ASM_000268 /TAXON_ID=218659 /ORGANISM="Vexillifera sp., Strain DIVA3 564/2" /LENGTH=360 /DNA_ID=CAMNT_0047954167 /DNA_START=69 /DNA_END=1151 /DNA_ORIENTATION=-